MHSAQMCAPGPATSRSPAPPGLPQNEHAPGHGLAAPAAPLPAGADVALELFHDRRDADTEAGQDPAGPRPGIEGQRAEQVLSPHVTAAAAPGQSLGPADGVASLGGLPGRHLPRLPAARKQLARHSARRVGPHAKLFQDRRRDALLE
jgi:hypothetical protein